MADGPEVGLAILDGAALASQLDDYHLFHSTRADLLRRAGRLDEAAIAYRLAHDITDNSVEQSFLARRLDELATVAVTGPRGSADAPEL
jgi:RNA polymerase sigma-70 factor (ECF subfamily)